MPEHLRALIVVLVLGSFGWLTIRPPIAQATSRNVAVQWRNLWLTVTLGAFLLSSFWLYALLVAAVLLAHRLGPVHALSAYCLLLLAVPAADLVVPGFGLINFLFILNQPRLLALLLLAPAAIVLSRQRGTVQLGSTAADKCLLAFLLLTAVMQLRESNITSTLRNCFYILIDIFLPYYVASRAVQRQADAKQVLWAFVAGTAVLGLLGLFETLRHWNLYSAMTSSLGLHWGYTGYLGRDGMARASASTGQPIILGYVMTVGLGFWLYLNAGQKLSLRSAAPMLMISAGLLASLSRGPWVGAAAMVLTFAATGRNGMRKVFQIVLGAIALLGLMAAVGVGQRAFDLLPFIGNVDTGNITYRQRLFDNAWVVINRNLWLGSTDYMQTPEMQSMIQGQGIIDIVNSYVRVALDYGMFGLVLFVGFFVVIAWQLWNALKHLPFDDENRTLGRSMLAVLVGILTIITTASSIGVIPNIYWIATGLSVSSLKIMKKN